MTKTNTPQKILIIRLSSIGDILLTTPLIRVLRQRFPDCQIDFLVKSRFAELLSENPFISNLIAFDDTKGFSALSRLKNQFREEKYHWLVNIHKNIRTFYLRLGAGFKTQFTYKKHALQRFLLIQFKWNRYNNIRPVYLRYLEDLGRVGIFNDEKGLDFFIAPATSEKIKSRFRNFIEQHEMLIGIVPGAGYATKCWLPAGFAQVADQLITRFDAGVIFFGGSKERNLHQEITGRMQHNALTVAGELSLQESGALMSHCDLVISNDSGLMHLAAALKKKLVAIFGSTTEELGFFPCAPQQVIVQKAISCRPCTHIGRHKCPKKHFKCMREISPEMVIEAVETLLFAKT